MTRHFRSKTPNKAHPLSAHPAGFRRGGGKSLFVPCKCENIWKNRNQLIFNEYYENLQRHVFRFCSTDLAGFLGRGAGKEEIIRGLL